MVQSAVITIFQENPPTVNKKTVDFLLPYKG